jgi:SNF2 family DNA or RNA helicase
LLNFAAQTQTMGWLGLVGIDLNEFFTELDEDDVFEYSDIDPNAVAAKLKSPSSFSNWIWDLENSSVTVDITEIRTYEIETEIDEEDDLVITCSCRSHDPCKHIVAFWHVGKELYAKMLVTSASQTVNADNHDAIYSSLPVLIEKANESEHDILLSPPTLSAAWQRLDPYDRAILTMLALLGHNSVSFHAIYWLLEACGTKHFSQSSLSQRKMLALIEQMEKEGFVKSRSNYYYNLSTDPLAHSVLTYQAQHRSELLESIYLSLQKVLQSTRYTYLSEELLLILSETTSIYVAFGSNGKRPYQPITQAIPLIGSGALSDPRYIASFTRPYLKMLLATQGPFTSSHGANMAWYVYAKELLDLKLPDDDLNKAYYYMVLEAAMMIGDTEMLDQIGLRFPNTFIGNLAAGWKCLIVGEYEKATAIAAIIAKAMRTERLNGAPLLRTVWLLRIFTSIKSKVASDDLRKQLNYLTTSKISLSDEKKFAEAIPFFMDHKFAAAENALKPQYYAGMASMARLLVLSWIGEDKVKTSDLPMVIAYLGSGASYWLREVALMKQRLGIASEQELQSATDDATKYGWGQPILHFYKPMSEWEAGLAALMKVGGAQQDATATARIIWMVDTKTGRLQPKEQKANKSGWSSGRDIGAQNVVSNNFIDSFDKQIVHSISKLGRDYFYYQGLMYKDVVLGMIGHPRLFLAESPTTQVHFVDEPVSISIKERGDDMYEFGFNISFEQNSQHIIAKETPTKYRVYQIQKEHKEVLQAMGKERILIPKSAKEDLEKAIAHVGGIVEVQSTVGDMQGSIPEIEADATIYAQVVPIGSGFMLELFVRPLKTVPTYCIVGEGDANLFGLQQDKTRVFCMRDLSEEKANLKKVVKAIDFLNENKPTDNAWLLDSDKACLGFLSDSLALIEKKKLIVEWPKGEKYKVVGEAKEANWNIKVASRNDWFTIDGALKLDEENVLTMQELVEQINLNGRFIQLNSGNFMSLSKAFEARIRAIAGLTQTNKKTKELTMHGLAAGAMSDLLVDLPNTTLSPEWTDRIEKIKNLRNKKYPLPKGLNAELRSYQKEGFAWLSRLADWGAGACLADDMGLGKTLQVQALMLKRASDGPALVVAPASVVRNWVNEIKKFTPSLEPLMFSDVDNREKSIKKLKGGQVMIVTYNLLQREAELFASRKFSTIVLDEAQAIKNAQTKRSDVVKNLQGDFKIITTGTPIENHLGELWSLFEFINPGFLGSSEEFTQRFVGPIERDKDENRRNDLRRLIQPFMLRRLKKDHLKDLPSKTEILLSVEMSKDELAFYEALRRDSVRRIEEMANMPPGERGLRVLAELTRLRQACCNPRLIDEESTLPCSKLRLFDETVTELIENGHKALVFSQFVTHLSIIREHLDQRGIKYQYLDGSTPTAKRQESIDAFQAGEGDLFLISLKAGGAGINLTAADYVIHMDPWWNPAVEDQATDRAHRMGQTKPVTVYRLITAGTIEEKILALHEDKRDLADSLLEGTDISARLNTKDLIELMKLN